jgi:hypothetical protein
MGVSMSAGFISESLSSSDMGGLQAGWPGRAARAGRAGNLVRRVPAARLEVILCILRIYLKIRIFCPAEHHLSRCPPRMTSEDDLDPANLLPGKTWLKFLFEDSPAWIKRALPTQDGQAFCWGLLSSIQFHEKNMFAPFLKIFSIESSSSLGALKLSFPATPLRGEFLI